MEYERLERDRRALRDAARLLASDLSLHELLGQIAVLLTEAAAAPWVIFAVDDARRGRAEYVFHDCVHCSQAGDLAIDGDEIAAVIEFRGRPIGRLRLRREGGTPFEVGDSALLETIALQLGGRIASERQDEAEAELLQLATVDALTGVGNRHAFDARLAEEWRRCARSSASLALGMLDVDFFKRYNDSYGHVGGDACLKAVAAAIAGAATRPGALVARYGGEEFAIVLPECGADGAIRVGLAICDAVRALALAHDGTSIGQVTVSVGIAVAVPDASRAAQDLVQAADAMLYEAKRKGRNRVAAEGFVSDAPAVLAHAAVRDNLPRYPTPLVGREREAGEIVQLLQDSRLATIVGTGGLGKTRVAVQAASNLLAGDLEGVWFVDLAPVTDPAFVASTIAGAIGFELPAAGEPTAALVTMLKTRRFVVVLDNCEHVVAEVARNAEVIVAGCPDVRVLATSREPLNVDGEMVYHLDPLDETSAIALFIERARRADRRFTLAAGDEAIVAEICRQLDGIALAIELAAARVHVMSARKILAELGERFALLTYGRRTALPRHQTMRALIDWSYDLLTEGERAAFRRLSVFVGSFTLDSAERICGTSSAVLALADKSLLVSVAGNAERYRMLDSIRTYALERLHDAAELGASRRVHAAVYADISVTAADSYGVVPEEAWLIQYEPDLDNFRAAFDWAIANDLEKAVAIGGNLPIFLTVIGFHAESLARSEAMLAVLGDRGGDGPQWLRFWLTVSWAAWESRDHRRSIEAGERALAMARRLGHARGTGEALHLLGRTRFLGAIDPELGLLELRDAVEALRSGAAPLYLARALSSYGHALSSANGKLADGAAFQLEGADIARASGFHRIASAVEMALAETEFASGEIGRAIERTRRATEAVRDRRWPFTLIIGLGNLASYLGVSGDYEGARVAAREAISLARAYALVSRIPARIQAMALVEAATGDPRAAARLLGFVDASYERRGMHRERTEAIVAERLATLLAERLKPNALRDELASGRTMAMDAACALAIGPG